jgi:hypothetical protein
MAGNYTIFIHVVRPGPPSNKAIIADLPVFNNKEKATNLAQKIVGEYNQLLTVNGIQGLEHQLKNISQFDGFYYARNSWTHVNVRVGVEATLKGRTPTFASVTDVCQQIYKRITDKRYKIHIIPGTPHDEGNDTPGDRPHKNPHELSQGKPHDMRDKNAMKYVCGKLEEWIRKGGWGR